MQHINTHSFLITILKLSPIKLYNTNIFLILANFHGYIFNFNSNVQLSLLIRVHQRFHKNVSQTVYQSHYLSFKDISLKNVIENLVLFRSFHSFMTELSVHT